ncbi:MAG: class I SAM-dependent methyltransferase [Christensenellaceae bacterium]
MSGFFRDLQAYLDSISFDSVLEAGCGEGKVFEYVTSNYKPSNACAFDLGEDVVKEARAFLPQYADNIHNKSIYESGYDDEAFDLVICCEVLEHLDNHEKALQGINRIAQKYILLSVPKEPLWRVMNMARLKYLKSFGNTPGHINHWSKSKFIKLVSRYGDILQIKTPTPWTMVLLQKSSN